MFKVTYEVIDPMFNDVNPIVLISYDGQDFSLIQYDDELYGVLYRKHDDVWDYFGGLYFSIREACEAIFTDVLIARTENGTYQFDEYGMLVDYAPLTYYDLAA